MENTIENKQKLFAQYWGQEVAIQNEGGGTGFRYDINEATICDIKHDYLELTPLSLISDEDVIEVTKILLKGSNFSSYDFIEDFKIRRTKYDQMDGTDAEESTTIFFKGIAKKIYKSGGWKDADFQFKIITESRYSNIYHFRAYSKISNSEELFGFCWLNNTQEAFDYLRSKGYALPFMGLSVDKQIEYGWIKLKTTNA